MQEQETELAVTAITEAYRDKIFPGVELSVEASKETRNVIRVLMDAGHHSGIREVHVFRYTGHGAIHGAIHGYSLESRSVE